MIRLSRRTLRALALLTLLVPTSVFLLTWVRPLVSVPSVMAIAAAFMLYIRADRRPVRALPGGPLSESFDSSEDAFSISRLSLCAVIACALLWTFLSGIGGMFYQNEDHYGRNAILHDLLNHTWPVYFEGTACALTYYIAYWLVPALFGKAAAALLGADVLWGAANAALFAETVWFLTLIFLLLLPLVRAKSLPTVCLALLCFVMFSGMDGLMAAYQDDWNNQIEWWAGMYQFSSHTTCLFWVYNQSTPAWLAALLLLSKPADIGSFALIGLAALPFSPMPFLGLFVYFAALALVMLVRLIRAHGVRGGAARTVRACLTGRNLLACLSIAPSFLLYFAANRASSDAPLRADVLIYSLADPKRFMRLVLFWLIEFGALSLVLGARYRRDPIFLATQLALLAAPVLQIGYKFDFSMRFSIPGLTVLSVYAIRFLLDAVARRESRYAACALSLLLLIGSITPLLEFERGAYKVMLAGTNFMYSDPYGTVMNPDADTFNFVCEDVTASAFYRHLARKGPAQP